MSKIKCDVHCCEHCNCGCDICDLDEIKVCNCQCNNAEEKKDTMCNNFKEKEAN